MGLNPANLLLVRINAHGRCALCPAEFQKSINTLKNVPHLRSGVHFFCPSLSLTSPAGYGIL